MSYLNQLLYLAISSLESQTSYVFALDSTTLNVVARKKTKMVTLGSDFHPTRDGSKLVFWEDHYSRTEVPNFLQDTDNVAFYGFDFVQQTIDLPSTPSENNTNTKPCDPTDAAPNGYDLGVFD